jgi:hypothetical protein
MGNSSSVPRAQVDDEHLQELTHGNNDTRPTGRSSRLARRNVHSLRAAGQRASTLYDSFRRHHSTESMTNPHLSTSPAPPENEVEYEQENRPLVGVQDVDMPDISPSPYASRRRSTMSRLGSRVLPESVVRGLLSSGEETAAEGRALRLGSAEPTSMIYDRPGRDRPSYDSNSRLSLADSISRLGESHPDAMAHRLPPPFPVMPASQSPSQSGSGSASPRIDTPTRLSSPTIPSVRFRNRFSRVRDSIALPSRISSLFGRSSDQLQSTQGSRESVNRPRVTFADESDHLLPSLHPPDHRHDADDPPHELDAVEPEARTLLSGPRVTSGMSTIRRFQPGLRSRSTRLIRRGEHPPLSQVLQLAAAAIAAQLSGHANGGHSGGRHLGETFDGSIQNFVQTLQDAATAQAGEAIDMNANDGDLPPVNFMRVFQFPNDENGSPIASQAQSRDVNQMDLDSITGPGENDRSVTLVLVGVRSLPHGQDSNNGENGTLGPSLDTLLSLPFLPPANVMRNGSSGALFRRSDTSARVRSSHRRHSMTNFSFPAQYETQRHQRTRATSSRASNTTDPSYPATPDANSVPNLVSESPPGPNPPPSTPADIRSGQASPIRRPSSASAVQPPNLPDLEEHRTQVPPENPSSESSFNIARQRRRSDSEFARRPELGSGAARRNGMVEPDHPPAGVGRSWLIYVVGTNVSPDHPAFTMPSLFTDHPSYEDMQMLSALLGPVKPPVATQDDVGASGGLFRLIVQDGTLVGDSLSQDDGHPLIINNGERCLICLSDYVPSEEVRRLSKCQHRYHRECIDEVSFQLL